jgi:hypothetical protein
MLKYIAEILAKFSMQQRILALLLLLFTVVIITIGPNLITAAFGDSSDLKKRIENLEKEISVQDSTIRANQRSCTDEIIRREKEILDQIDDLENRMRSTRRQEKLMIKIDTVSGVPTVIQTDNSEMMMRGLNSIKSEIEKDMKKRKN